ncbi:MAG: hypothetical protein LUC45_08125 [Paraprevotella sp.]|nr:hypothetical protein [Paraprevotella sp.]
MNDAMMCRTIISLRTLFCFLVFAMPFVEFVIPGGDLYLACVMGAVAFVGVGLEVKGRQSTFVVTHVDVLFFVCWGYALVRMPLPVDMALCIKFVAVAGIWCYCRLTVTSDFQNTVLRWMIMAGLGQAVIGLLQNFGVLKSFHSEFALTGTFGNPGPFGGYLSVVLALLFSYVLQEKLSFVTRGCLFVCAVVVSLAWVLSDSLAAWCAAFAAVFLLLYLKYLSGKRLMRFGVFLLFAIGFPAVAIFLYSYRTDSADARMLIWKVCGEIVSQSPFMGVGTGRLAAYYMPAQASFLTTAAETIRCHAGDNPFAYNETLTVLCEQGIVGLFCITLFWVFVIRGLKFSYQSDNKSVFLFPVVSLLVFSKFSYPLNMWSFVCLLTLMPAIGLGRGRSVRMISRLNIYHQRLLAVIVSWVCCAGLVLGFVLRWRSQVWMNDYGVFATSSERPGRVVDWFVRHDPFLLACGADAAFLRTDYELALTYMDGLSHYVRAAQWNIRQGECYEEVGDTLKALECYEMASQMMQGLMSPVFAEFNLYRKGNQKDKALLLARRLITFRPKIENHRTRLMRKEAWAYIRNTVR